MSIEMKTELLKITVVACLLMTLSPLSAQDTNSRKFDRQDFMTKRNAYITAEVGLTTEEAVKFIPLENELKEKMFEIGRKCRELNRELRKNLQTATEETYLKIIDCQIETGFREAQLEKEYYEKFKAIISAEKLYKYQQAELKFMREFMGGPPPEGDQRRPPRSTNPPPPRN